MTVPSEPKARMRASAQEHEATGREVIGHGADQFTGGPGQSKAKWRKLCRLVLARCRSFLSLVLVRLPRLGGDHAMIWVVRTAPALGVPLAALAFVATSGVEPLAQGPAATPVVRRFEMPDVSWYHIMSRNAQFAVVRQSIGAEPAASFLVYNLVSGSVVGTINLANNWPGICGISADGTAALLSHSVNGAPIYRWTPATGVLSTVLSNPGGDGCTASGALQFVSFEGQWNEWFLLDANTSQIFPVSHPISGASPNGDAWGGSASDDGTVVAFSSDASNLIPVDLNGLWDVFVRDRVPNMIQRVSRGLMGAEPNGQSSGGGLSADGRFVSFSSDASNLVPNDTNGMRDAFLFDRQTGSMSLVSRGMAGAAASAATLGGAVSADGGFVVFSSAASNLVPNDTNGLADVFTFDRLTGQVRRVSVSAAGAEADGASSDGYISGDGRYVSFRSAATNLVEGDFNGRADLFVIDVAALFAVPGPPTGLTATVSGSTVTMTWTPPTTGGAAIRYMVEAAAIPGGAAIATLPTSQSSISVPGVANGAYYVRVRATNAEGTSGPSNEVAVVVGPPACTPTDAPTNLASTVNGSTVSLTWTAPVSACPPTGYVVQAGSAPRLSDLAVISVPATTLTGTAPPGTYFVRVVAVNAAGMSGPSNEVTITVGAICLPPGAPSNLAGNVNGFDVSLTWTAPVSGGALEVYLLEAGSAPTLANIGVLPVGGTTFAVTAPAATYYMRVRAQNRCGTSLPSNEVIVEVPASPPVVRVLYAIPRDRSLRTDYLTAIRNATVDVQSWYRHEVVGRTFSLYRDQPEVCYLPASSDYYARGTWWKVFADIQGCAPVRYGSSRFTWVLYVDVVHACDDPDRLGAGIRGVTMLPRQDMDGLIGAPYFDDCGVEDRRPPARYIGGLGHELGHAFGLPHPPGCDNGLPTCDYDALMSAGYVRYPATYLRAEERTALFASPFFSDLGPQLTVTSSLMVELFNVDDILRAKMNGVTVTEGRYGVPSTRDLTSLLLPGTNTLAFELDNTFSGGWTYGYRIWVDGVPSLTERCGQAGTIGCANNDTRLGIVYRRTFSVVRN